jgi:hypothetical protein
MTDPDINITERSEGLIFWDGIQQIAIMRWDATARGTHTLTFLDDPLGWGDKEILTEAAAECLAFAYAAELRAIKSRRH